MMLCGHPISRYFSPNHMLAVGYIYGCSLGPRASLLSSLEKKTLIRVANLRNQFNRILVASGNEQCGTLHLSNFLVNQDECPGS